MQNHAEKSFVSIPRRAWDEDEDEEEVLGLSGRKSPCEVHFGNLDMRQERTPCESV
jgi:hypothetical protein